MSSVSIVGLALSLVFGFLFLALIAELYYLLWWKKRIINRVDNVNYKEDCGNSPRRGEFMYMSCWTKPSFLGSKLALEPQRLCSSARLEADTQVYEPQSLSYHNQSKNIWFRQFGEDESDNDNDDDDDDDDDETLPVPPRFLFTIIEETKEDLESEDGGGGGEGSRKCSLSRRHMSDLVLTIETTTPYLTPLASPTAYFTPPLTPSSSSSSNGFNPLFESSSDAEIRRIKPSPPPKFKFLKDAEDKLFRRQIIRNDVDVAEMGVHEIEIGEEEEAEMGIFISSSDPLFLKDEENGSFIAFAVAPKNNCKEDMSRRVQFHGFSQCLSSSSSSTSSQVLPVTASPNSSNKRTFYSLSNVQTNPVWSI